jgi:hypothetical protein
MTRGTTCLLVGVEHHWRRLKRNRGSTLECLSHFSAFIRWHIFIRWKMYHSEYMKCYVLPWLKNDDDCLTCYSRKDFILTAWNQLADHRIVCYFSVVQFLIRYGAQSKMAPVQFFLCHMLQRNVTGLCTVISLSTWYNCLSKARMLKIVLVQKDNCAASRCSLDMLENLMKIATL